MPYSVASESDPIAAEQLIERSREIERLKQKIEEDRKRYRSESRHKYAHKPGEQGLAYQKYMQEWGKKMEHIGTEYYPSAALEIQHAADVLVDVALNSDGSVRDIRILRSSGYPDLDESVIYLVKLAAPFSPFPETIRRETDILHITRQWRFIPKSQTGSNTPSLEDTQEK